MRRRYVSDSYTIDKARRLRRIKRRAVPELQKAFENGELSLRKFDILSRLSPRKQRRIIASEKATSAAALLAAKAINQFLDGIGAGTKIMLPEVIAAISSGLRA
jgi:hypothetical protein